MDRCEGKWGKDEGRKEREKDGQKLWPEREGCGSVQVDGMSPQGLLG